MSMPIVLLIDYHSLHCVPLFAAFGIGHVTHYNIMTLLYCNVVIRKRSRKERCKFEKGYFRAGIYGRKKAPVKFLHSKILTILNSLKSSY